MVYGDLGFRRRSGAGSGVGMCDGLTGCQLMMVRVRVLDEAGETRFAEDRIARGMADTSGPGSRDAAVLGWEAVRPCRVMTQAPGWASPRSVDREAAASVRTSR